MNFGNLAARRFALVVAAVAILASGCHGSQEWEPLTTQKIYVQDKFYDVAPLGPTRAIVVGYGGKILETSDSGLSWNAIDAGTDFALFSIDFASDKVGWIVGQEGLILKTTDGGESWQRQRGEVYMGDDCRSPAHREGVFEECRQEKEATSEILRSLQSKSSKEDLGIPPERIEKECRQAVREKCSEAYLFAVSVIDENNVVAIGDRSVLTRTRDGGRTWTTETLTFIDPDMSPDWLLAFEDPVLYDVEFLDSRNGYVVGEFGKIYHTLDGGESWTQQHKSLMDETIFDVLDMPTLFDVEFLDEKNGMVVGLDGRVGITTDGGQDWNFVPTNVDDFTDPFYAGAIQENGVLWAVGASGQIVISEPGAEFQRGSLGGSVNSWLRRIRFYDQDHGWVVGGFGLIMNTKDGGKTWYRRFG
ncbi:MAG: YCF48-related protein [Deltaproteobacteria bacterium]